MTKRRKRWLRGLSALALLAVLATPAVHWRLYGWVRGEAFYHGWPTSYWRHVVANSVAVYPVASFVDPYEIPVVFHRAPNALVSARDWVADTVGWYVDIDRSIGLGQPDAVPMLTAFLTDDDPDVRHFAALQLGRIGAPALPAVPVLHQNLSNVNGAGLAIMRITRDAGVQNPTTTWEGLR